MRDATTPNTLPALPEPADAVMVRFRGEREFCQPVGDYFTADQMRAYALATLAANAGGAEGVPPVAWLHYAAKKSELRRVDFHPRASIAERNAGWVTVRLAPIVKSQPSASAEDREIVALYETLHKGKLGAHWLWCAAQGIAAGQSEDEVMAMYGWSRAHTSAAPALVPDDEPWTPPADMVERLQHAVEGECDDLAITARVASDVLRYVHGYIPVASCCGRSECGGECGNDWDGVTWVRLPSHGIAAPAGADGEEK